MSKFGWSMPAGCNGTPFDEDQPCYNCGSSEYECICKPCPKCESVGDTKCYTHEGCGCDKPKDMIESLLKNEAKWKEQNAIEYEIYLKFC